MVAAHRKDTTRTKDVDTRAEWCGKWRIRAPRTTRTRTQELVAKAVARARTNGDVEHEAFLNKFWNLDDRDEVMPRNFPHL